jgi:uncharacterized repeat protein (TIGR02059 family)
MSSDQKTNNFINDIRTLVKKIVPSENLLLNLVKYFPMKKLLVIILLAFSSIAQATTYYISTTGTDGSGHTGLSGDPWKTMPYACTRVTTSGDIIHINAGTYITTAQCELAVGVSIEGDGNTSIIRSQVTSDWSPTIALVSSVVNTNGNQHISNIRMEGSSQTAWGGIYISGRGNVKIYNCTFVDFKYTAVIFNGKLAMYEPGEASAWCTGNEFHDNIITNCAASFPNDYQAGALHIGAQEGMLIYNNTITENSRPALYNGYCIKYYNEGFNRGVKIYNNTLTKAPPEDNSMDWNFAIELWNWRGGVEIYDNTIYGGIDVLGGSSKGPYAFQADIHDNIIGYTSLQVHNTAATNGGIYIEEDNTGPLYIHHNLFRNIGTPFQVYPDFGTHTSNTYIYSNIFSGIGTVGGAGGWSVLMACAASPGGPGGNPIIDNFNFINNTVYVGSGGGNQGLQLPDMGIATNITVRNNIFQGFEYNPVYSSIGSGQSIDYLSVENNIFYGNGTNAVSNTGKAPTHNTTQNNIVNDPKFISSSDFHLQAGSPAIGAGLGAGLPIDYDGNAFFDPPSIGAYEYNSSPPPTSIPVYQSSVIENAAPSILVITYNLSLANIVPSTTAFTVMVNSVARSVSSVAIVSGKVQLTLATPVIYGDVVTVAYTKPASNPLQTASGGEAASITAQSVTNNCIATIPVYVSSVVENATPTILDMTYSLTLTNIVPATTAFTVLVNSVTRSVNSVSIVSGKVRLTLASPVVYGDVVTVAYTKPASNPLQTASGGQAASITAQPVTNNCTLTVPVYVSSVVQNATPSNLEITFSLSLANIVPAASAFTVLVNSVARTVNSVAISGTKVTLTLASPVIYGDVVTVAYTKPGTNPLQTSAGGQVATFTAKTVTNNCTPASPTYISSVVENATPTVLELTFSLSLANIVPATSAFTVLVNSVARSVNSVTISGTKVQLVLASPVVYGDVITVAYTKPASNPLQTPSGGQAASFSAQSVTNNCSTASPLYVSSVIENATPTLLDITFDLSLANIVPANSAFSVLVNSVARAVNSVTIIGNKVRLTLASAVVYGDVVTVAYTKPASNPLQTPSGGQVATFSAKPVTNNCNPASPVYVSSVVENATPTILELTFDLSLANIIPATSAFIVMVNSVARSVNSVTITGNKVRLTLASSIVVGNVVTVAYTKPASNPLQTPSGGQAASFSAQSVTNNCSSASPVYVSSVVENATPALLEITFDLSLANIVPANSAFVVLVNSVARAVNSVTITGNKVQLTLASAVIIGDVVTVAYTKPASNSLQTTSGGQVATFSAQSVTNNCNTASPVYVSSVVENAAPSILELTFNLSLTNIIPATTAFTVMVNSVTRTVNSVTIAGNKVQLALISPVVYGDIVTVAYTKPAINPLQTTSGGQSSSFSAQPVTNNCSIASPVYVSSVIEDATPELLDITFDLSLANIVPSASAFNVVVNSASRNINLVAVTGNKVQLTLESAVVYGDIITVAYTKPASSQLQTPSGGQAASFSAQSVTNNCAPPSPVYISSVVENSSPSVLLITYDLSLANIVPSVSVFDVQVNSQSREVTSVSIVGNRVRLTLISEIVFDDTVTVSYSKPAMDPLQSTAGGEAISFGAQPVTNNTKPQEKITIYPNPAYDHIYVKLENMTVLPDLIRLVSFSGKIVLEEKIISDILNFEISFNLDPGVYVIQFKSRNLTIFAQTLIIGP